VYKLGEGQLRCPNVGYCGKSCVDRQSSACSMLKSEYKQTTVNSYIVTYSGCSIHDGTLLHSKSQYTTVKHSQQLFEHTYTSDLYGTGTFIRIEFFQQDLLWQSSNTRSNSHSIELPNTSRDNPSSGYRCTCTPHQHFGVYSIINLQFTSPDDLTPDSNRSR
jgi:hypothetical protein